MNQIQSSSYPKYSYPLGLAAGFVLDLITLKHRSFQSDSQACLQRLKPPLHILGVENIPQVGPALITLNHYYRPGFHAWWLALAVAAFVPAQIHFGMTGELTFPGKWYAPLGQAGSRWLLRRLARMYGFTTMPPMPPRAKDVAARAKAVRSILKFAWEHPNTILALAPEGGDNVPSGSLARPSPGAGRFISLIAGMGFPILPVGAYEQEGKFCLSFGQQYQLEVPQQLKPDEKDRHAIRKVMSSIAAQLPVHLRGEFSSS